MSIVQRGTAAAVLWAIFLLVTALLDAFFQVRWLDDLLFHSVLFPLALTCVFLAIAPFFVQVFGLKFKRGTSANEDA